MRCAFQQLQDYEMEVVVVPWKRAQHMVEKGYADGFFAASQNNERNRYAQISSTIADQEWRWYWLKSNPLTPKETAFKSEAKVGAFIGANMLTWLEENHYKVSVTSVKTKSLLDALRMGRADAILANNKVIDSLLQHNKAQAATITSGLHSNRPLGVYFSSSFLTNNPNFLSLFNLQVEKCRNAYSIN